MTTITVAARAVGDGVLNVKKPAGWTSHDVVAKIRSLFAGVKVGHAGTLDPAATGVLPILVGRGTRVAEYLAEWDKEYRAVLRLGVTTDTLDATGQVIEQCASDGLTGTEILAAVGRFRGTIHQTPPMFSAVKVGGVPLYKTARAGRSVDREPRLVTIHELDVLSVQGCDVELRVVCSKGTYVRSLCADIGDQLGVGGHLLALERRRVGPLPLDEALLPEDVASRMVMGEWGPAWLSIDRSLCHLGAVMVDDETAARVRHGVPIPLHAVKEWVGPAAAHAHARVVRIKEQSGLLLGLGRVGSRGGVPTREGSADTILVDKVLVDVA
jgi:tRNA pseudouridine55 synthase